MKESPLVGSPSNVKTKCLAFIFEHTKGTPDAGAFWRVIQARVNKTAMNHACFCRLNCVYLVRESFKCKLDASQFAFSFISFLILGMKSDCIGFTRCIHACFSIFFQSFAGFPFLGCQDYSVRSLFAAPTALRAIRRVDPDGDLIRGSVKGKRGMMLLGM